MTHDMVCDMLKTKPLSELTGEEMRSAREIAYSILRADHYRHVRGLAEDVKSEVKSGSIKDWEELIEYVHGSVDGSERVIYTRLAQETILVSDNSDAMLEDFGTEGVVTKDSINWSAMAYHAIERDLMELLSAEGVDHDYWNNLEDTTEETESE